MKKESITIGIVGLIVGAVTMTTLSTTAQTVMTVEKDVNKAREELVVTRVEKVDVTTTLTLKQVKASIAEIDRQFAMIDAQVIEAKKEMEQRRMKLVALKAEIEAQLPLVK